MTITKFRITPRGRAFTLILLSVIVASDVHASACWVESVRAFDPEQAQANAKWQAEMQQKMLDAAAKARVVPPPPIPDPCSGPRHAPWDKDTNAGIAKVPTSISGGQTVTIHDENHKAQQVTVPAGMDPKLAQKLILENRKRAVVPHDPIFKAIDRGDTETLEKLIAEGADIRKAKDGFGLGGLVARAMRAWYVEAAGRSCAPPPTIAQRDLIAARYIRLVKDLVTAGADPSEAYRDLATFSYITALGAMGSNPAEEISLAQYLLEHRATLALPDKRLGTALNSAVWGDHTDLLNLYLRLGNPDQYMKDGALMSAVVGEHWQSANILMDAGANPNMRPSEYPYGKSYYHTLFDEVLAKKPFPRDFIRSMIAHGANPNVRLYSYATPLIDALGDLDLMKVLLDAGADPNATAQSVPVLQLAMSHERIKDPEMRTRVVELLLRRGANPNARTTDGMTMLAKAEDAKTMSLLLDAGATLIYATPENQSSYQKQFPSGPVVGSLTRGNETLATLWLQKHRILDEADCGAVYYAARGGEASALKLLLDMHAPVEVSEPQGETPLIGAVRAGQVSTVKMLLDRKVADVNEATRASVMTPAQKAEPLNMQLAGLLLNTRATGGVTPLMAAVQSGRTEVVTLLLERGADVSRRDNAGRAALDYANERNDPPMVALLKAHGAPPGLEEQDIATQQAFAAAAGQSIQKAFAAANAPVTLSRAETGTNPVLPGDDSGVEEIECERRSNFTLYGNANEQGRIGMYLCESMAERVRELALHANKDYAAMLKRSGQSGVTEEQIHRAGLYFRHQALPNGKDFYVFPLFNVGHGLLALHIGVLYDGRIKRAAVVELAAYPMCERKEYADTPVCKDAETVLKSLAVDMMR
jgi:ankyrin repeat protein